MEPQSKTTFYTWLTRGQLDDAAYRARCTRMIRTVGELERFAHTAGRQGLYVCAITRLITTDPMVVSGRFIVSRRVADELGKILSPEFYFATTLQLTEWMVQSFVRAKPWEWVRLAGNLEKQKIANLSPERINAFRHLLLLFKEAIAESLRRDADKLMEEIRDVEKRQERLRNDMKGTGDATPDQATAYEDLAVWHRLLSDAYDVAVLKK